MGLDQYLYKKCSTDITFSECLDLERDYWNHYSDNDGSHAPGFVEVGYLRKANQIHGWFCRHCTEEDYINNGEYLLVTRKNLECLLADIEQVLKASVLVRGQVHNGDRWVGDDFKNGHWEPIIEDGEVIEDPSVAMEILPVMQGPFFGHYEYDGFYIHELEVAKGIIEDILVEHPDDKEFAYNPDW